MRRTRLLALVPLIAVVLAGCGSSDDAEPAAPAPAAVAVKVADTSLGKVLVDDKGMTLYLFTKDTAGTSACEGACAELWPPVSAAGTPTAGEGLEGSKLSTVTRPDGAKQVAFAGKPLYRYAKDAKPGDVTGHKVGGVWFAVSPDGEAAGAVADDGPKGY